MHAGSDAGPSLVLVRWPCVALRAVSNAACLSRPALGVCACVRVCLNLQLTNKFITRNVMRKRLS